MDDRKLDNNSIHIIETGKCEEDLDVAPSNEVCVVVVSDYIAQGPEQLSLIKGQHINVIQRTNENWWWAEVSGSYGYVPSNHIVAVSSIEEPAWQDEEYFGSYGNLKIHHEMLSDKSRTQAYLDAIIRNNESMENKVVLDVGCGTGILSMMCAKYGHAKKVYAVEASPIVESTKKLIEHNNLADRICVLHGHAETVELPEKVDLIISEWMGTALLFEMMIESVIVMRDKYLKEGGTIWPTFANLYLVPCSASKEYQTRIGFWDNLYGFDFSVLRDVAKEDLLQKPKHDYELPQEDCLSKNATVLEIDLTTASIESLEDNQSDFSFTIHKGGPLHGFCTYFEVEFKPFDHCVSQTYLHTGPEHELTHWKQNLFLLDEPFNVSKGDKIEGTFRLYRNKEFRRHLRIDLNFKVISGDKSNTEALLLVGYTMSQTLPGISGNTIGDVDGLVQNYYWYMCQNILCLEITPIGLTDSKVHWSTCIPVAKSRADFYRNQLLPDILQFRFHLVNFELDPLPHNDVICRICSRRHLMNIATEREMA